MELPGRRFRGRPKRRIMDVVKEDMKLVSVRQEDGEDRLRWRWMICGDSWREKEKKIFTKIYCHASLVWNGF